MSTWVHEYYSVVDSMDLGRFVDQHTDDAKITFGNNPTVTGKQQIGEAIGGFWSTIDGMRHDIENVWETPDGPTIMKANVHYQAKSGSEVVVPCVSLLKRSDRKISTLQIYIDLAPLSEASVAQ